jgi:hypothetical protein
MAHEGTTTQCSIDMAPRLGIVSIMLFFYRNHLFCAREWFDGPVTG